MQNQPTAHQNQLQIENGNQVKTEQENEANKGKYLMVASAHPGREDGEKDEPKCFTVKEVGPIESMWRNLNLMKFARTNPKIFLYCKVHQVILYSSLAHGNHINNFRKKNKSEINLKSECQKQTNPEIKIKKVKTNINYIQEINNELIKRRGKEKGKN